MQDMLNAVLLHEQRVTVRSLLNRAMTSSPLPDVMVAARPRPRMVKVSLISCSIATTITITIPVTRHR